MNAHRSLKRLDVTKYPVDKIALMVASEFLRASDRAHYITIVTGCFHRARELMGILETIDLNSDVAAELRPAYELCREKDLFVADRLAAPEGVREFSLKLAEAFEAAAHKLKGISNA
jgi:hypothetical protein